jgi:ABC-2 type transport system ATP-binding protein
MSAVLEVRELSRAFGEIRALDRFSMRLEEGDWVALLGPNGAGKTTLMRCVAGLCKPDRGEIALGTGASRAEALGVVPQELALYPRLTARENLEVFARVHGLRGPAARERVDWALGWTHLGGRADDLVCHFSGGMQRRLNIACGVLHRPRVVLLDEPTVGVDPQAREHIWEMLRGLRADGATLLQSTHQIDEIETIVDRAVIVDHGRALAAGTVDELVHDTFGNAGELRLRLDSIPEDLTLKNGFTRHGDRVEGAVTDVVREVPELLDAIGRAGAGVSSMRIETPGLAAVFSALTGRELRE